MSELQTYLEQLAIQPGDEAAINAIDGAYRAEGRWEELLRIYEENALRANGDIAAKLLRTAAEISAVELSSMSRAESYLQRALDANPTDIDTLRALRENYISRGDYERGVEIYEKEVSRTADAEAKFSGSLEIARIYQEDLGRFDRSLSVLRQAQRIDRSNPIVFEKIGASYEAQGRLEQALSAWVHELELREEINGVAERIGGVCARLMSRPKLHKLGRKAAEALLERDSDNDVAKDILGDLDDFEKSWSEQVEELRNQAEDADANGREKAVDLWITISEVWQVYGNEKEEALRAIDHILAKRPGHPVALKSLEEIYAADGAYDELTLKLEMMATYARDADVAVDLYLKAAMHHAIRLDNADAAAKIYHRVLDLEPGQKLASNALAEFYRESKQWEKALDVLVVWAERATQMDDKIAANYACCRILDEELGDRVRAKKHYETLLELDPSNLAAARALEEVYRESGEDEALARTLHAKLTGLSGEARLPVLKELGDIYNDKLDKSAEAMNAWAELYVEKPSSELREKLEELAASNGLFGALVKVIEAGLGHIQDEDDLVDTLRSLAALYEGAHEAPREALRIYRRITGLRPDDELAKESLERLLQLAAESTDKISFFREQVEAAASEEERISILHKLATELVETAKSHVRAIDVYHEILRSAPGDIASFDALISLYQRDDRWAEVAETYKAKLNYLEEGEQKLKLELELASIYTEKVSRTEDAVSLYLAVFEKDPSNDTAFSGLERLLSHTNRFALVAARLQPRYEDQGEWISVVSMLEIQVRAVAEASERTPLLLRLAEVYSRELGDDSKALAAMLRAYQADPGDGDLQATLEELAEKVSDYSDVIRAYRAVAATLDSEVQRKLLQRSASLAERSADYQGAVTDLLRTMGFGEETDNEAKTALKRVIAGGAQTDFVVASARRIAGTYSAEISTNFYRGLSLFFEEDMDAPAAAISLWRALLEVNPGDEDAQSHLDALVEGSADPAELVSHLKVKLAHASDDASLATIGCRISELMAGDLDDRDGAIENLEQLSEATPGQRRVWQILGQLLRDADRLEESVAAMQKELGLLPEGEERTKLLLELAGLQGKELGNTEEALSLLAAPLAQTPENPLLSQLLEDLRSLSDDTAFVSKADDYLKQCYLASARWSDLAQLLEGTLERAVDSEARTKILLETANIKAERLEEYEDAFSLLERAFRESPEDEVIRNRLDDMAARTEQWEVLADTYQALLGATEDRALTSVLRGRLAKILDKHLGRSEEALDFYGSGDDDSDLPRDLDALEAMERILREQERWPELVPVLNSILPLVPAENEDRRATLLMELGGIYQTQLSDDAKAAEIFTKLVALQPDNQEALRSLDTALGESGDIEQNIANLESLVALGSKDKNLVDDTLKLAGLKARTEKDEDAIKLYRSVLLKRRNDPEALLGLEELLEHSDKKVEIAQILEPVYTAQQNHEKLAWVLEQRLEGLTEANPRKALLRRIGDIYENRLQQKDLAFRMARRSMGEDSSDMGVRMWIEKLAGETEAFDQLAAAYVEEAEKTEEPKLQLQFHRRAAALFHEKLDDLSAAVVEYEAILKTEVKDEKSLTGLETIYRATESWAELVQILSRRVEVVAGLERRHEYLVEIAEIQKDSLGDYSSALETNRTLLGISPDDIEAFERVEELLETLNKPEELSETWENEIRRLANKRGREQIERRLELTFKRGRLLDDKLGDIEPAMELFSAVLSESPTHVDTRKYLSERAESGAIPAVTLLESNYQAQSEWEALVTLYEKRLEYTAETDARRDVFVQMARVYDEEMNVGDMAFLSLTRAHNENRVDVTLHDLLYAGAEKRNTWEEFTEVLGVDLEAIPDPEVRQNLLKRVANIYAYKLENPHSAVEFYEKALAFIPDDVEAMAALDKVLVENELWAQLPELIGKQVELTEELSEKIELLDRMALVFGDRLHDAAAAQRTNEQILSYEPDHPAALKHMQRIFYEEEKWDALCQNLDRQSEVLTSDEEQVRIHAVAGEIYTEELGENEHAIAHWQKVTAIDPTHEDAVPALDFLLRMEERWEELAEHYQHQLAHTQDVELKADINRRLGTILADELGRSEDALTSWLEVLEVETKNQEAMQALLDLYTERAMWEELSELARRLIPLVEPAEAKEVKIRLARALGENLGERDEAIRLAREIKAAEPHTFEQMHSLAEVLENIEAWEDATTVFEKAAEISEEEEVKSTLYSRAIKIYFENLEKPNDARSAL
ncbi:hypothetical protein KAI87_00815 [Myxococcota bacterium]|nr:hypothetical protein [Myxococcota bacterium]